jgi:hypothetical protein
VKHLKGKVKLLFIKLTSLEKEAKESRQIFTSATQEINNIFKERFGPKEDKDDRLNKDSTPAKNNPQNKHAQNEIKERVSSPSEHLDPEIKKVFRQIATKVHPDKLSEDISIEEREKKIEIFQQALKASEQNDIVTLAHIAITIGIELPKISTGALKKAEEKISSLKKEIKKIESTYAWNWFFCSDPEKKDRILNNLLEIMLERMKNENPGT